MTVSQVAKVFIFAAKLAKDRSTLAAWVEGHREAMSRVLPGDLENVVLNEARAHYRGLLR